MAKRTQDVPAAGKYSAFLTDVEAVRALLLADVRRRSRPEPVPRPRDGLRGWPLLWVPVVEVLAWGVAFWGLHVNNDLATLGGVGVALLTVMVWTGVSVRQFREDWQRRREDSLETATRAAVSHQELVVALLGFGRASLNFVADEYRDREARVARRTGLVVGPAQAGGILGLIGLGIAASATLTRAFSDNAAMSGPVRDLIWLILLVILSRSVTALLIRHNTSALLNYSDILQRVSSAKAILDAETNEGEEVALENEQEVHAAEEATEQQERREAEIETDEWAREDRELREQVSSPQQREEIRTE
ncbi:hypothetical protein BOO71_0004978 [Deinococcus marmoris]|uniref:Uncharacterized protein n=2 Tax=Deinococcus marmoris TaxID=249408 RepID=A0A1U7NWI7_9DEIO|nr:hypothetical protein BOO71_0009493 [Deinococcus marmoris]OLV18646.1 hypothetical protein BOO71_0004978 [Deinococcus marmoris]